MRLVHPTLLAYLLCLTSCLAKSRGGVSIAHPAEQLLFRGDDERSVETSTSDKDKKALKRVRKALKKADIIPTVVDNFHPETLLSIEWPTGAKARLGHTYKPEKLQDEPAVDLYSLSDLADLDSASSSPGLSFPPLKNLILTMTDPDAPSRDNPKWGEMCHWIYYGIPSRASAFIDDDLHEIIPYKPPGPPPKTGRHRYVFLMLVPINGTEEPLALQAPSDRQHWGTGKVGGGVRDWAKAMGLRPIAANFVYSKDKEQGGKDCQCDCGYQEEERILDAAFLETLVEL